MPALPQGTIKFLSPSFMLYADETEKTTATAVFSVGDSKKSVPLVDHTFVQVGGEQIGGPELIGVEIITRGIPDPVFVVPAWSGEVGPGAYAVLQPGGSPEGYGLDIVQQDGSSEIITFWAKITQDSTETLPPEHTTSVRHEAVYNGFPVKGASLSVTYQQFEGGIITTPLAEAGSETGGLLTGTILSYNIVLDITPLNPVKWFPKEFVVGSVGLPIVVFGKADAPSIAIFRPVGHAQIVQLEKIIPQ
jgi:hypothetical protein